MYCAQLSLNVSFFVWRKEGMRPAKDEKPYRGNGEGLIPAKTMGADLPEWHLNSDREIMLRS